MPTYHYRRRLELKETLPAVGAAVGAAGVVFYLARLLLQRTPLVAEAPRDLIAPRDATTVRRTDGR